MRYLYLLILNLGLSSDQTSNLFNMLLRTMLLSKELRWTLTEVCHLSYQSL